MELQKDAKLVRIFLGESDTLNHQSVYEIIVLEARKAGLAGATVFKGMMGFGGSSRIHSSKFLRLSEELPVIIEIVDKQKKIEEFLPKAEEIFKEANCGGLITIERAEIIKYSASK